MKSTTVIALAGKGGVGKTSISALTVWLLAQKYPDKKILAIDADPAVGLATALGVEVFSTVDDIRKAFVRSAEEGNTAAGIELSVAKRCFVMSKKAGATNQITLTGGCAKNDGLKAAIEKVLKLKVIDLPVDPQLIGALGAAEFARQKAMAR